MVGGDSMAGLQPGPGHAAPGATFSAASAELAQADNTVSASAVQNDFTMAGFAIYALCKIKKGPS